MYSSMLCERRDSYEVEGEAWDVRSGMLIPAAECPSNFKENRITEDVAEGSSVCVLEGEFLFGVATFSKEYNCDIFPSASVWRCLLLVQTMFCHVVLAW